MTTASILVEHPEKINAIIRRRRFRSGYPNGFACFGAYCPDHSFELNSQRCYWCEHTMHEVAIKMGIIIDTGEITAGDDGQPHCPDCDGSLRQLAIDQHQCRNCRETWTMTPIE